MAGYEQTTIVGNVGRDPELRYLQSGTAVCDFSVAVSTRWTDRQTNEQREKTNWYKITCWGKLAEVANEYVKKGTQLMVVGTVTANAYMAQDGEARASLDLKADNFQLLGGRGEPEARREHEQAPPSANGDDIPF